MCLQAGASSRVQTHDGQWEQSISRRAFLKLGVGVLGGGAAALAMGALYSTSVEPGWIQVVRQEILLCRASPSRCSPICT